jgi:MFS family permease
VETITDRHRTFGTPIYVAAVPDVMTTFGISQSLAVFPISCHAFGLGFGALFSTAFSEVFGRRIVYRITAPLALIFTLISGSASDITTMSIARVLTGLFASPALTVGGGIISDIWDISLEKNGTAFAVLYVMIIIAGTQTGPMVSAAIIADHLAWRWVFWLPAILIVGTIIIAFCLPETYHPQLQRKHNEKVKGTIVTRETLARLLLTSLGRPLHMLLVEPTVFPTGFVIAVMQFVVFSYFTVYAALLKDVYHHTPHQVGMAFSSLIIGSVVALPTLALFDRIFYQKHRVAALKNGTMVPPEKRLYPAMLGFITLPVSLFW